jgi:hypothetical protein
VEINEKFMKKCARREKMMKFPRSFKVPRKHENPSSFSVIEECIISAMSQIHNEDHAAVFKSDS